MNITKYCIIRHSDNRKKPTQKHAT